MYRCIYSFTSSKGKFFAAGEHISFESYNALSVEEKANFIDDENEVVNEQENQQNTSTAIQS